MKKYLIWLVVGNTREHCTVFAEIVHISSGYYSFYCDGELVACYPMDRTVIYAIEKEEE